MKIKTARLLFEQSGTFKKEFLKLGIKAEDYDIQNEFDQTDHVVDLFHEIEEAYDGKPSIFDTFNKNDLIMAFFPCIRFEDQIILHFKGNSYGYENFPLEKKMTIDIGLMEELSHFYVLVNKLFITCIRGGYRLIMENPYSESHFLKRYWCFEPSIIDRDRRENGDYFKKPTQYWFINCTPEQNVLFEPIPMNTLFVKDAINQMKKKDYIKTGAKDKKTARSMSHPDYANRFIRTYLL